MSELKKKDLKKDIYTGELIRINYSSYGNLSKSIQDTQKLLTQIRLYKKNR